MPRGNDMLERQAGLLHEMLEALPGIFDPV